MLPATVMVGAEWLDRHLADDIEKFRQPGRGKNVPGIFTGHLHMTSEMTIADIPGYGPCATNLQCARQPKPLVSLQPPHYRIVTMQEHNLEQKSQVEL